MKYILFSIITANAVIWALDFLKWLQNEIGAQDYNAEDYVWNHKCDNENIETSSFVY